MYNLATMYYAGQGVPQDFGECLRLYGEAARQGDGRAQLNLGVMYYTGQGGEMNLERAIHWVRQAAEQGISEAQRNYGVMLTEGKCVKQDDAAAEMWFRRAVAQGNTDAQLNLNALLARKKRAMRQYSEIQEYGRSCAHSVCSVVDDMDVIWQLVLEEIEAASKGNKAAQAFATSSGISPDEYIGAHLTSCPAVDGPKGAQTFLNTMALSLLPDSGKVAEFKIAAADYILEYFHLGKYSR